ncbi:hypothetical protein NDU88_001899 [Pleurodeles waltl]|uniref:Uncharacterized protein n=1 Tax=Pleurodeles waltl TaxID=8319 RepID=A0AAV7RCI4_PLEWA|nr:hypothetical protein NDU88_001899 [Pleurodeles waltl]
MCTALPLWLARMRSSEKPAERLRDPAHAVTCWQTARAGLVGLLRKTVERRGPGNVQRTSRVGAVEEQPERGRMVEVQPGGRRLWLLTEPRDVLSTPVTADEPSRAELLAAIQGSRVALEGKIEMVVVEVNLLRADLRKVSDKVKVAEGSIVELQMEHVNPTGRSLRTVKSPFILMNNVQTFRKRFLEVKAKLCAMNITYMLLCPARLKVLSGSKSHLFEHPEEVWRWQEMWDKVTSGRPDRTSLAGHRASGVDGPDWRTRGESQMEGTAEQVVDIDTDNRIEIQQDGTMSVVTPGLADGSRGALVQVAERIPADT